MNRSVKASRTALSSAFFALFVLVCPASPEAVVRLCAAEPPTGGRWMDAAGNRASREVRAGIVAAYYLTGWKTSGHGQRSQTWDVPAKYHPLLGGYQSSDPDVADRHIALALEHRVNTFVVPSSRPKAHWEWERNFESGLMRATRFQDIRFAMMFNNEPWWDGARGGVTWEDLTGESVGHMADHYFPMENYLRIEGNPALFLFHSAFFVDKFGVDAFRLLVRDIRDAARSRKLAVYLVGDFVVDGHCSLDRRQAMSLCDAVTCYVDVTAGTQWTHTAQGPKAVAPYLDMVTGYQRAGRTYSRVLHQLGVDFIPAATTGFDNSPLHNAGMDNWLVTRTGASPELYARMLRGALASVRKPRMVIVGAWNEFHEGWVLEPTKERGDSYLRQVRDAIGGLVDGR